MFKVHTMERSLNCYLQVHAMGKQIKTNLNREDTHSTIGKDKRERGVMFCMTEKESYSYGDQSTGLVGIARRNLGSAGLFLENSLR